jgi:hypothetical protein
MVNTSIDTEILRETSPDETNLFSHKKRKSVYDGEDFTPNNVGQEPGVADSLVVVDKA